MSKVTITFDTDNAAFEEDYVGEFKWVLSKIYPSDGQPVVDSNGNTIGKVEITND